MRRILFTGGGTAGHVSPNLPLIATFRAAGWQVDYAGSRDGIERELIEPLGIGYHVVPTGKLRRYLAWENLADVFRVLAGCVAGARLCRRLRPDVVFAKGGFVSVPVAVGAYLARVPVVAHESDLTPGLATRIVARFARTVCTSFEETRVPNARAVRHTGTPLRAGLLAGAPDRGRELCGFDAERPVLLVVGGSLGSQRLNALVRAALPQLLERYQVAHVCGHGNADPALEAPGYRQFEFLREPYADLLACAALVVSRAGANGLYELIAARKPSLLVPLGRDASRGDQLENARWAVAHGCAEMAEEEGLDAAGLVQALDALWARRERLIARLAEVTVPDGRARLVTCLLAASGEAEPGPAAARLLAAAGEETEEARGSAGKKRGKDSTD